jgi:hypothetical protein
MLDLWITYYMSEGLLDTNLIFNSLSQRAQNQFGAFLIDIETVGIVSRAYHLIEETENCFSKFQEPLGLFPQVFQ